MIYLIAYAVFCIAFAWLNSYLIRRNKRILHGWNGLLHLAAAVAGWYFFGWQVGVSVLFVANVFFNTALNLFRGLPVGYISPEVIRYKSISDAIKNGKVVDYIENKVFDGNGILPKLLYIGISIFLIWLK